MKKPPLLHQKINRSWDNPLGRAAGQAAKEFKSIKKAVKNTKEELEEELKINVTL